MNVDGVLADGTVVPLITDDRWVLPVRRGWPMACSADEPDA
jgi:hypothetical protein